MNTLKKIAAVSAVFAITATACSAPKGILIGGGSKTAMTIDGQDVNAGVFIYSEIMAYYNAQNLIYSQNGSIPTAKELEDSHIDSMEAADWIQQKATEYCKDYIATDIEFNKINGELTNEELKEIDEAVKSYLEDDMIKDNGIGEDSLRLIASNSYKQQYLFDYYYGIDKEFGCSEDELKEFYVDNNARYLFFSIDKMDTEGNALEGDDLRDIQNLAKSYVDEINAVKGNEEKLLKFEEVRQEYKDYIAAQTTTVAADSDTTTTTTTTTTTSASDETTTTTTATPDPYQNEATATKYTTTTSLNPVDDNSVTTTTTPAEKAERDFNDKLFSMKPYVAEVYDYSDTVIYIVITEDVAERLTADDLWNEDTIDSTLYKKYYNDFNDMMTSRSDALDVSKNDKAYKRYDPFKLDIDEE